MKSSRAVRCMAAVIGISTVFVVRTVSAQPQDAGYVISNPRVIPVEGKPDLPGQPRDVTVAYNVEWSSDEYPGLRTCTFIASDAGGDPVAERTVELFDLSRGQSPVQMEVDLIDPNSRPRSVRVECAPGRADDPEGVWNFTDVMVERDPNREESDLKSFRLNYQATWDGAGHPSANSCTLMVTAPDGEELFTWPFDYVDASGSASGTWAKVVLDHDVSQEPASGTVLCQPL